MADRELTIRITLNSQGVVTGLKDIDEKLTDVKDTADKANTDGFSPLQATLVTLNATIGIAQAAIGAFSTAFDVTIGALERGSAVNDVADAFTTLSEKAGTTADVFLNQLNQATGETITNFELQKAAIEASRAGADPKEFIELASAARALAEQTGGDTKEALDELSRAFETGQARVLQNKLGIIDIEAAEKSLATQLGITREELNKEQQVQAARTAILEASRKKTAELGTITKDAGDRIATFNKVLSDAKDKFVAAIAQNAALNNLLAKLEEIIKSIDFEPFITGMTRIIEVSIKVVEALAKVAVAIVETFDTRSGPQKAFDNIVEASDNFSKSVSALIEKLQREGKGSIEKYRAEFEKLRNEFKKVGGAINSDVTGNFLLLQNTFGTALTDLGKKTDEVAQKIGGGTSASSSSLAGSVKKVVEETKALKEATVPALEEMDAHVQAYEESVKQSEKAFESLKDIGLNALNSIASALSDGFQKGDISGILGSIFGDLGGEIPGFETLGRTVGQIFGDVIGKAFESLGGDNAGTKARKSADKFFTDAFDADRLAIIVGGQLREITDLVFEGNTPFGGNVDFGNSAFFDFFNQMSESGKAAFNGLGLAFAALLGDIEHLGGTLGAVFANNIGTSLNNLQLLIQATGATAEQLKKSLVDAFLDGQISAIETFNALTQIDNIMKEGIPDGLGLVNEAFDNLKAAGERGGRAAVDALKDLGAEAEELQLQTLPQLFQALEASGRFTADEIGKLQSALATYGIDTLEELKGLSAETAIAILANLQANNFPFAETQEEIDALKTGLDEIPQTTRRNIIFDVKLNMTNSDRDILNRSDIELPGGPGI